MSPYSLLTTTMLYVTAARFARWVQEHYGFVFRAAWALTGSRALAEELTQDAFEIAWRHRTQLREERAARAWLYQILRRETWRYLKATPASEPWDDAAEQLDGGRDADLALRVDLLRALQRLRPIHREILVLYYLEDIDYAGMARALEIAPGTVMSRLSRARAELRAQLAGYTLLNEDSNE